MHIETVKSRPEELKSIISVEEKLWQSIDKVDSSPQYHALKSKRVTTMPKRYLPYQLDNNSRAAAGHHTKVKTVKQEDKVVCKSVGSNGLVFMSESEDDVDVETCGGEEDNNSILDGDKKSVVTLKNQEEKEPSRKKVGTTSADAKSKADGGSSPPEQANTLAFVAILLHALKCSSCENPACRKMIMVLQHYKQCAFKRKVSLSEGSTDGQKCRICAQLLRIVALHAKNDCKMAPNQIGCPVLMCDTFRLASFTNKVKMMKVQPNVNFKKSVKVVVDAKNMRGSNTIGRRVVVTQPN